MPAYPRKLLVPSGADCTVHVISRCVRRAWLCGKDPFSGSDFTHRRQLTQARLELLSSCFAIHIHAFALMDNHLHIVLSCRPSLSNSWPAVEVARRWKLAISKSALPPTEEDCRLAALDEATIQTWRERLGSLSWFMRCLKEFIARRANQEDGCTGRFWEGRFRSQLILDDAAMVLSMAYVDLNPVRAGAASTLEGSDFTSIQMRLRTAMAMKAAPEDAEGTRAAYAANTPTTADATTAAVTDWLSPMGGSSGDLVGLPMSLERYVALLEWTGSKLAPGKTGVLASGGTPPASGEPASELVEELSALTEPPLALANLGLDQTRWLAMVAGFGKHFCRVVGTPEQMAAKCLELGQRWLAGMRASRYLFAERSSAKNNPRSTP